MQNDERSIELLNKARAMELNAIHQYMQHHYYFENENLPRFAEALKKIAITEMRHAEMLALRIRDLGGVPVTLQSAVITAAGVNIAASTGASGNFFADKELEEETLEAYQDIVNELSSIDAVSEQLMKRIMLSEESHRQYFGDIVSHLGDVEYLSNQMGGAYKPLEYTTFTE